MSADLQEVQVTSEASGRQEAPTPPKTLPPTE
jgi:hypothetical protein